MEYVRVPKNDWQDILDATRSKIGSTEKMVSGVVAPAIAGIAAGGGGNDGTDLLRSVWDGTVTSISISELDILKAVRVCQYYTTLTSVNLPDTTIISGGYAFSGCSNLTSVNLNKLEKISTMSVFESCTSLEEIELPSFYQFGNNANFQNCTALKRIDFSRKDNPLTAGINNLNQNNFKNCPSIEALIIRAEDFIWKMGNVNNFTGSSIESGSGYIYVPSSLLAEYQAATNWSAYAAQFRAIEDYPDICEVAT